MGKPTCIWLVNASSLVKCYFCQVSRGIYIHDQFCSPTCGFSTLKAHWKNANITIISKKIRKMHHRWFLKNVIEVHCEQSRIASSSTLKAAFVLRKKSFPEENFVLASASSDADGAPNSLVKETLWPCKKEKMQMFFLFWSSPQLMPYYAPCVHRAMWILQFSERLSLNIHCSIPELWWHRSPSQPFSSMRLFQCLTCARYISILRIKFYRLISLAACFLM